MGSMTFERHDGEAGEVLHRVKFDSSPKYSICKANGYSESTFSLKPIPERTDSLLETYEVHAATSPEGRPHRVGTLTAVTTAALWARRR